jgi:hypothetical protein
MQLILRKFSMSIFSFVFIFLVIDSFLVILFNPSLEFIQWFVLTIPSQILFNFLFFRTKNQIHRNIFLILNFYFIIFIGLLMNFLLNVQLEQNFYLKFGSIILHSFLVRTIVTTQISSCQYFKNKKVAVLGDEMLFNTVGNLCDKLVLNEQEADVIVSENINLIKNCNLNKQIISLDCSSDTFGKYVSDSIRVEGEQLGSIFNGLKLLLITNDIEVVREFLKHWNTNFIVIVTDNLEIISKFSDECKCMLYEKLLIHELESRGGIEIVADFYMVNASNINVYRDISHDLFKMSKQRKLLICSSRRSAFLDTFVLNILKEKIWEKLSDKQINNNVIRFAIGDLVYSQHSIINEMSYLKEVCLENHCNVGSVERMIGMCFKICNFIAGTTEQIEGVFREKNIKFLSTSELVNFSFKEKINIQYYDFFQSYNSKFETTGDFLIETGKASTNLSSLVDQFVYNSDEIEFSKIVQAVLS